MRIDLKRAAPTLLAGALALVYVIVSPPSRDLAAHLLRAKLFRAEGFGLWSNWWYGGHHLPGYSVLFPPVAALLTPQVAAALAATATAALFEPLAREHFGEGAWLGALWWAAGTATSLFTGRLTFAFGLFPALATVLALQRRRPLLACALAGLTALASPVAALFAALAAAAVALGRLVDHRRRLRQTLPGLAVAVAALVPVLALAVAFPEGGTEPFPFATFWPILLACLLAAALAPREPAALRAGALLYALGLVAAYAISTPVGSNAARLGALVAGPVAVLLLWRRRSGWLAVALVPLAYLQWLGPVGDLSAAVGDPSTSAAYWRPLLAFLDRQPGPPFRIEIPFTDLHWEAYYVAPQFSIARGWERQLDIKDNGLFYSGTLTAAGYHAWLDRLAVRFVAVADADVDYSARPELRLIDRGLPYLRLVDRTPHFRIFAVTHPAPIGQGAATLTALGPNSVTLQARRAGRIFLRIRWTPYWKLGQGSGCVAPAGDFTALSLRHAGPAKLVIGFSLDRIGARSPRCR
jgi:hypothetical protein